jgi:hypothetical protein
VKQSTKPQSLAKQIDAVRLAAVNKLIVIDQAARQIESIISNPESNEKVIYALQAILVELSNETSVGVDTPAVAGSFYTVASLQFGDSDNFHHQQGFHHLKTLLSNPSVKTANALIKYWDDPRTKDLRVDPFPATEAHRATGKTARKERQS